MSLNNATIYEAITNKSISATTRTICSNIVNELYYKTTYFIYSLGIVNNSFCVIVFVILLQKSRRFEGHMYKYLLLKAICDFSFFFIHIFEIAYYSGNVDVAYSWVIAAWNLWLRKFVLLIMSQCSGLFELAATFDCFLTINKKLVCCQQNSCFYSMSMVIVACGVALNIYAPISLKMTAFQNKVIFRDSEFHYKVDNTPFRQTDLFLALNFAQSLFRDCFVFTALIVCNALILASLHTLTKRRRRLMQNEHQLVSTLVTSSERAERNKILMIACMGLNFALGHLLVAIFLIPVSNQVYTTFWSCFEIASVLMFYMSYATPCFFYFIFNKTFNKQTRKIMMVCCPSNLRQNEASTVAGNSHAENK